MANRPDAMTFVLVDYKGGAAFKDCVNLPHTVGMVTDLDTHLQKADFFDVATYPDATFHSTRVDKGANANKLKVTGELTLHGVTHPVVLDVTINKVGEHAQRKTQAAGFDATTTLKRSDFGIKAYVPMISDEIRIHITSEAIEAASPAQDAAPKDSH